jgi:bifunctional non-homologous end joining protein LigD
MRLPQAACSWLNRTDWGDAATYNLTGMETSPKEMVPDAMARAAMAGSNIDPPSPHAKTSSRYRARRDPGRTNEPFGPLQRPDGGVTRQGDFVVHLHDARRRHYDLRLEVGGALESFAVPKGPSLAPDDKRLAVRTEPHPLDYLDFEQVIPEGNYGAGAMILWDRGRVHYLERTAEEGLAAGRLEVELLGHKLRGRFLLVRTDGRGRGQDGDAEAAEGKESWLLFKKRDAFADPERDLISEAPRSVLSGLTVDELPEADAVGARLVALAADKGAPRGEVAAHTLTPMLCATGGAPLSSPDYLYELKLDGVRILASRKGPDVALFYRTRRPATAAYPEVARALAAMVPDTFVLDGEIVAFDEAGKPSFQRLARRIHARRPLDVQMAVRAVPVVYVVFDVLALGDRDLRGLPLIERQALLAELVRGSGAVRRLDVVANDAAPLLGFCRQFGLEGVVAKRRDSTYRAGVRSPAWVKIKCEREADFVVVGFTRGEGQRARLGALDLATYDDVGELVVRGKVGSGLDDRTLDALLAELEPLAREDCAAQGPPEPAPRGRTFVEPEVVVGVRFAGWTHDGRLRAPVFRGVRTDVPPTQCTAAPPPPDEALLAAQGASRTQLPAEPGASRVTITNRDKVFWPDDGYTKGDLADYYASVARWMLPHLKDRPVVLVRHPDGITGKSFYQWNLPEGTPPWIRTVQLVRGERRRPDEITQAFLVNDLDTLLHIANLGAIDIHVLAGRAPHLEHCDFLTMDFDLGESELRHAITLARTLHGILEDVGLPGFPKTSGKTGLHVLVPLGPGVSYDTAQTLGELLGRLVTARHPDLGTMERTKRKRGGRVYVDTGQIGRTRTIVAPYSVRAHPGATVSTPLDWDEVGFALDPRRHTLTTVPARLAERGDPMADLLRARPDLPSTVARLEARFNRAR